MTRDEPGHYSRDHRAGSRLAASRSDNRSDVPRRQRVPPAPKPDPQINLEGVVSDEYYQDVYEHTQESYEVYDPTEAANREMSGGYHGEYAPGHTNGNGYQGDRGDFTDSVHYTQNNGYARNNRHTEPHAYPPASYSEQPPAPPNNHRPYEAEVYDEPPYPSHHTAPGELSKQEQQLLLMHTIQLYDDEWRLSCIRTTSPKGWLVAYLTPRDKSLTLQQAISKQVALRIKVDSRGNTDVSLPKKRGFLRRLITWLRGE